MICSLRVSIVLNKSGLSLHCSVKFSRVFSILSLSFLSWSIIDVKFEGKYEDLTDPLVPVYTYQNAVNVTSTYNWSNIGVTMTKPNAYTVRLTGPGLNVFTDQYYRFVLKKCRHLLLMEKHPQISHNLYN